MIVFNLTCRNTHRFEGWFKSAADFEQQRNFALPSCPVCGVHQVTKTLHAPYVASINTVRSGADDMKIENGQKQRASTDGGLKQIIDRIIANAEDVGDAFPEEARKIHYHEAPERSIRGNASSREIGELQEEGIEVAVLRISASHKSH